MFLGCPHVMCEKRIKHGDVLMLLHDSLWLGDVGDDIGRSNNWKIMRTKRGEGT